jgi:hypothetical protein
MKKVIVAVFVASAALCAGTAQAGNVSWSIGINAPGIGTVVSNAPGYSVPVYVQAPLYAPVYAPVPTYHPEYRPEYRVEHRPEYRTEFRPHYVAIPTPVAYPRYGAGYRPVPVVYVRGREGDRWFRHGDPRWSRDDRSDDRGNHRHPGRHD